MSAIWYLFFEISFMTLGLRVRAVKTKNPKINTILHSHSCANDNYLSHGYECNLVVIFQDCIHSFRPSRSCDNNETGNINTILHSHSCDDNNYLSHGYECIMVFIFRDLIYYPRPSRSCNKNKTRNIGTILHSRLCDDNTYLSD